MTVEVFPEKPLQCPLIFQERFAETDQGGVMGADRLDIGRREILNPARALAY